EINGKNALGTLSRPVPNLFAMNFQAVGVAEKLAGGGINLVNGHEVPSDILLSALSHTDASVGAIVQALEANHLFDDTLLVVTAKHGQTPRVGAAGLIADSTFPNALTNAGVSVAQATQDDVALLWLTTPSQTSQAVSALQALNNTNLDVYYHGVKQSVPGSQVIDQVLFGPALQVHHLGDPTANSRTPDIIVTLKPGFVLVGNPKKFQFKRA